MSKNVLQKIFNGSTFDEIHPITKASNVFTSNGKSMEDVFRDRLAYGVASGSGTTLSISLNPVPTKLEPGFRLTLKASVGGTGQTLNVNGIGAKAIKKPNGNPATLVTGGVYTLVYDGTDFILQAEGGGGGTAAAGDIRAGKTADTDTGPVTGSLPVREGGVVTPGVSPVIKGAGIYDDPITIAAVSVPADKLLIGNTVAGTAGTMPNRGAVTITPSALAQTILAGYHNGFGVVAAVTFDASKLLIGTSIAGTAGTMPNITANDDVAQGVGKWPDGGLAVYPRAGYRKGGSGAGEIKVTVDQIKSVNGYLQPEYIKSGAEIFGVQGTLQPLSYIQTTATSNGGSKATVSGLPFKPKFISMTCDTGYASYNYMTDVLRPTGQNISGNLNNSGTAYINFTGNDFEVNGFFWSGTIRVDVWG
ncbi:hypothetical protein ACDZ28_03925 [Paenibacillus sp. RS8]|uniref:hypothetical protein n=1 Tax=Paenibacillus sp. RS8 TaxID=3242681 RepID=UPI0035C15E9F